jgi:hypothetical protein
MKLSKQELEAVIAASPRSFVPSNSWRCRRPIKRGMYLRLECGFFRWRVGAIGHEGGELPGPGVGRGLS